jgi:hypothetical protein
MATLNMMTQLGIGDNFTVAETFPEDCSYFEAMCMRAEYAIRKEDREAAQKEVDWMVDAMNTAEQEERMKTSQSLVEHLNDEIGSLFDGIHFQSNDDLTRMSVRSHLNGVMQGLMDHRHIQDYKVVCDASNNPNSVIESNELVVDIAYKDIRGSLFHVPYRKHGFAAVDVDLNIGANGNSPSNRGYNGGGQGIVSGGYVNATGAGAIGNMVGQLSPGGSTYTFTAGQGITLSMPEQKQTADLPSIEWNCRDDSGQMIKMELKPEGTIGAHEALQLMMLLQSSTASPLAFSPYMYVKKHSLERHFRFSAV